MGEKERILSTKACENNHKSVAEWSLLEKVKLFFKP